MIDPIDEHTTHITTISLNGYGSTLTIIPAPDYGWAYAVFDENTSPDQCRFRKMTIEEANRYIKSFNDMWNSPAMPRGRIPGFSGKRETSG